MAPPLLLELTGVTFDKGKPMICLRFDLTTEAAWEQDSFVLWHITPFLGKIEEAPTLLGPPRRAGA